MPETHEREVGINIENNLKARIEIIKIIFGRGKIIYFL